MKNTTIVKKTKLTKQQIKAGIFVHKALKVTEVPWRKLNFDVMNEVQFGRKAFVIMNYGKPMGIILPISE